MPAGTRWWLALRAIGLVVALVVLALLFIPRRLHHLNPPASAPEPSSLVGRALPSLAAASAWTAGPPLPDSLRGRVVAVAFLSLNLPGSARAAGVLEAWHEAYARYGLAVVGVQVPEFAFAAEPRVLTAAAARLGLRFTVGLDPSLDVWRGLGASAERPRIVVADPKGRVAFDQGGVAALGPAETTIRALLETMRPSVRFPTAAVAHDDDAPSHPPVHLGRARVAAGPLTQTLPGHPTTFTAQLRSQVEGEAYAPYPVGRWTLDADGLTAARGGAENFVALRYHAGALGAVMGPGDGGPVRVWILRDEKWLPPDALGADARLDGRGASYVLVSEPRLYALTRESPGTHVVKLSPDASGATFYALTFESFAPAGPAGP